MKKMLIGGMNHGKSIANLLFSIGDDNAKEAVNIQQGTALNINHAVDVVKMGFTFDDFCNEDYKLCKAYQLFDNDYSTFLSYCIGIVNIKASVDLEKLKELDFKIFNKQDEPYEPWFDNHKGGKRRTKKEWER